jgi:arabinogalactan endo-1,4-beta-galactosidase
MLASPAVPGDRPFLQWTVETKTHREVADMVTTGTGLAHRARRALIAALAALLALGMAGSAAWTPARAAAAAANLAQNPGFEDSDAIWSGWTYDGTLKNGDTPAVFLHVGKGGTGDVHGGDNTLGYWLDEPFRFTLTQTLTGLADGEYELSAWAEGGDAGMADDTSLKLFAESGGLREEAAVAITAWGDWRKYTLTIRVTGGEAVIGFAVEAPAGQWGAFDDVTFALVDDPGAGPAGPAWDAAKSLQASDLTPRSVKLQWSGASDPSGIAHYRIYRNGKLHATVPGGVTSYTVAGLAPNTAYRFRVEAGNAGGDWTADGPELAVATPDGAAAETIFLKGADISTLQAIEDAGGKYYDGGVERDLLAILKDRGVGAIRLRVWHDPVLADGYNDKAHTIEMAKRVKSAGLYLLIDFHYSDFWADPGKQEIPAAWRHLDFAGLRDAVYDYTAEVLNDLKAAGAYPDMVQIGNEINNGMLLPVGSTGAFDRLADLIGAGIRAVRDTTPAGHDTKIMIHLAEGGNNAKFRSFFDSLTAYTDDFDVIGLSFYPYWHGTYQELKDNLNDLAARYGKELIVVETAHPHTLEDGDGWANIAGAADAEKNGFPATPEGQKDMLALMLNTVAHTAGGRGTGVFYWEPAWIPVPKDANGDYQAGWKTKEGNAWDNQAMFDFAGNALPSLDAFGYDPANPPAKAPLRALEPEGVTVPALESPEEAAARLPGAVQVLYNEGSIESVPVEWPAPDPDRLSRIGAFRLTGRTTGPELPVSIHVTISAYRNLVANGGFEAGLDGWDTGGTPDAVKIDSNANNAHSGVRSLNYWHASDFTFTVSRTVADLPDGLYTLRVRASGGGGDNALRLFAEGHGGDRLTADIVNTGWNNWNTYTIDNIPVSSGRITFGVEGDAPAGTWGFFDDFELFRQVTMPQWGAEASLTAEDVGTGHVRLRWSGVVNPEAVSGYKIYRDGVPVATVGGEAGGHTVSGLSSGTTYTFQVEAGSDAGLWTDGGPTVTVTTRAPSFVPAPSDPRPAESDAEDGAAAGEPDAAEEAVDVVTVEEEALAGPGDGPVVIDVPESAGEVRLPANASALLGDRPLEVRSGGVVLRLPAEVLEQLAAQADGADAPDAQAAAGERGNVAVLSAPDGAYLSLSLRPPAAPEEWIARAERRTGLELVPLARLVDLRLARVDVNGKAYAPGTYAAPVTIGLRPDTEARDPELAGIYLLSPDGALAYAGGGVAGERAEAGVTRAGVYGLLEAARDYADVPDAHRARRAIAALTARLVVAGTDAAAGRFEPDRTVTRAEFAAMIARLLRLPDAAEGSGPAFADVPDGAWYAGAARAARAAGIATGDAAGRFRPHDPITREEMAVMLARAAGYAADAASLPLPADTPAYSDAGQISPWARDAVLRVTALGLMRGLPDGGFHPLGPATRAEAALTLYRLAAIPAEY